MYLRNYANGQVSAVVKGETFTNMQKNINRGSNLSVNVNQNLGLTSNGSLKIGVHDVSEKINLIQGNKYFIRWSLQPTSSSISTLKLYSDQVVGIGIKTNIATRQISTIYTPAQNNTNASIVAMSSELGIAILDHVLIVNLTAHGLDSLSLEECDKRLNFITGTKSTISDCLY